MFEPMIETSLYLWGTQHEYAYPALTTAQHSVAYRSNDTPRGKVWEAFFPTAARMFLSAEQAWWVNV